MINDGYYSIDYIAPITTQFYFDAFLRCITEMRGVTGPFTTVEKAKEIKKTLGDNLVIKVKNDCIFIM